jgi:hypothetical protein
VDSRRGTLVRITATDDGLRLGNTSLVPVSERRFEATDGTTVTFEAAPSADGRPAAIMDSPGADGVRLEPVPPFEPTEEELGDYLGTFRSDEAEATYTVVLEDGELVVKDRWGEGRILRPIYPDAFSGGGSIFIFRRDQGGRVTEVSLSQSRVWDLRFRKIR